MGYFSFVLVQISVHGLSDLVSRCQVNQAMNSATISAEPAQLNC